MRNILLPLVLLFAAVGTKAQVALISKQTACQPILVIFYADLPGGCSTTFHSNPVLINPVSNVYFDMYPGGPNMPINWVTPPPPGSGAKFTAVRVLDPGMAWVGNVFIPCLGGQAVSGLGNCKLNITSNWQTPSLISVKVFQ